MCGICGFNREDARLLEIMTNEMTHRGPDQYGFHCGEGVSLGTGG